MVEIAIKAHLHLQIVEKLQTYSLCRGFALRTMLGIVSLGLFGYRLCDCWGLGSCQGGELAIPNR